MPPDQKLKNDQEFLRSEQIEQMRLSKHEMYDLLLQPYQCDCVRIKGRFEPEGKVRLQVQIWQL